MIPTFLLPQVAFVAIRAYAAHSYIYYTKHENIITDHEFDDLCVWLKDNFEWLKPFDINDYLCFSALEAGTGYQLKIVGQTRDYAEDLLKDHLAKRSASSKQYPKAKASMDDLL